MRHSGNPGRQSENAVEKFKREVKSLLNLKDDEIFHPDKERGYGVRIATELNVRSVQLRRVYQEFLQIVNLVKNKKMDEAMGRLYRLYAISEYQAKRGVISHDFKEFLHYLFDLIDKEKREESFYRTKELLMSIVAYSKGER